MLIYYLNVSTLQKGSNISSNTVINGKYYDYVKNFDIFASRFLNTTMKKCMLFLAPEVKVIQLF